MFLPLFAIAALDARFFQYELQATVPAAGTAFPSKSIQNGQHFFCELLTMNYPTIQGGVDDGVTRLTGVFKSGTNQIGLSSGPIDLSTIAAPGRQRTVGIAGDPSNALNIPGFPWPYLYESSGAISCELANASTTAAAVVNMTFTGYLVPTYKVKSAAEFWDFVANLGGLQGPALNDNQVIPANQNEIRYGI